MDTETLAALSQSSEAPNPDPPDDSPAPSDQGQQKPETPEQMIARGEIPEGYTRDPKTKQIRPKKAKGRPRAGNPPPDPTTPITRGKDEAPDSKVKGKTREPVARWQKGVIAAGMTKLYRRTGKIVKAMDKAIGTAIIESAEDCGEAWDELARTNPRVRAFLLKLITGGAWGSILIAHAPIFMAVIMKDGIRKHIPFMKLLDGMLSDDEDGPSDISQMFGGIKPEDMEQMAGLAMQMMGQTAGKVNGNANG